jgi:hypothetical protein
LVGSFESGTSAGVAARAATTIGTLMRKTAVQPNCSSRKPPLAGPMPTPRPATAAQIPIAFGRSRAGKTFVRIESVVGMISAPPMPMTARLAISTSAEVAKAEASDPAPNTTRPDTSAPRRLKRSPRAPMVRSSPAKTSVYESTIHWSWPLEAFRSRSIVGSATLRIVLSREMIRSEAERTTSVHHLRSWVAWAVGDMSDSPLPLVKRYETVAYR